MEMEESNGMPIQKNKPYTYSDLKEDNIHHIFSFLTRREAAKTSLLSKSWQRAWMSYPVFKFDETELLPPNVQHGAAFRRTDFTEFISKIVDDSMETFVSNSNARGYRNKPIMKKFHLSAFGRSHIKYTSIEKWIGMALDRSVPDLYLGSNCPYLRIPRTVFMAKSLRSLGLMGFVIIPPLEIQHVDLCSLRSLSINAKDIDHHALQSILSSCPLLEDLYLECRIFTKIEISRFTNLKILKVREIKELVISTLPCLESLCIIWQFNKLSNLSINIKDDHLYSLRSLSIKTSSVARDPLQFILSKCPLLEDLHLNCARDAKIEISDFRNLKTLEIRAFKEVEITALPCLKSLCIIWYCNDEMYLSIDDAQKIKYLTLVKDGGISDIGFYKYKFKFPSSFSFDLISLPLASKAFLLMMDPRNNEKIGFMIGYWLLHFYFEDYYYYYQKLRSLLRGRSSAVTLAIIENEWDKKALILSGPACVIKELNLKVMADPSRYLTILYELFSVCHPIILCLWAAQEDKDLIKLMCENFIDKGDGKCWQQQLTDAKIEGITGRNGAEDFGPMELLALIDLLPTLSEYHKICFRLSWMEA